MPHWMPLKNQTRWVSEGCPRAVSLRLKPPLAMVMVANAARKLEAVEQSVHQMKSIEYSTDY